MRERKGGAGRVRERGYKENICGRGGNIGG